MNYQPYKPTHTPEINPLITDAITNLINQHICTSEKNPLTTDAIRTSSANTYPRDFSGGPDVQEAESHFIHKGYKKINYIFDLNQ